MNEKTSILVKVLADTDAVWIPNRAWDGRRPANVYFARRLFGKGGVPWESGGRTESDRKTAQRALEALAKSGAIVIRRPHLVKTLAVKLTDEAEAEARKLVGRPGMYSAWLSMTELAEYSRRPALLMTHLWVSERKLIGEHGPGEYSRVAVAVENMLFPALVRGFVSSCSDCYGRVSYVLTSIGWAWLDVGDAPAGDDLDGEPDREAAEFYAERLRAALVRLESAEPQDRRELGGIPLPVSIEGLAMTERWTPT